MVLTTETAHNLPVTERMGIVSAEVVFGVNAIKDVLTDIRGIFGGQSKTMQDVLKDARKHVLTQIQLDAAELGADAVVGIDFDFENIGSSGKMLMVVATGTAVRLDVKGK